MYSTDSFSLGIVPPLLNIHWLKIHVGLFLLLTPFSMLCCGPQMRSMPLTTCLENVIGWAGCCLYPSGFICQWSHAIMSVSNHASNAGISKHWVGALSAHTRGWKVELGGMTKNLYHGIFLNYTGFTVYDGIYFFHAWPGVNHIFYWLRKNCSRLTQNAIF